jgi:hypothetical protein
MRKIFLLCTIIYLFSSGYTISQFIYEGCEQSRYMVAEWNTGSEKQIEQSYTNDLDHFVELKVVTFIAPFSLEYSSNASQDSLISEDCITFHGNCWTQDPFNHVNLDFVSLTATSYFKSEFMVQNSCRILITGLLFNWGDYGGSTGAAKFDTFVRLADEFGSTLLFASLPLWGNALHKIEHPELFLDPEILYTLELNLKFCIFKVTPIGT